MRSDKNRERGEPVNLFKSKNFHWFCRYIISQLVVFLNGLAYGRAMSKYIKYSKYLFENLLLAGIFSQNRNALAYYSKALLATVQKSFITSWTRIRTPAHRQPCGPALWPCICSTSGQSQTRISDAAVTLL